MNKLKKILVANDDLRGIDDALSKAEVLEHYTGAEIEVLQVVWDAIEEEEDLDPDDRKQLLIAATAAESAALGAVMKPHRNKMAAVTERIIWDKCPADAILKELKKQQPDLLIKPIAGIGLKNLLHAPLDWRLIRKTNCPVLSSNSDAWKTGGTVLAAIDTKLEHAAINKEIISTAVFFARALGAGIHLVTATPGPTHPVSSKLIQGMLAKRTEKLEAIATASKIAGVSVHTVLGEPATAIVKKAEEIDATVTVLGTHARTGIKKLLLGNTVEKILRNFDRDTVTVRATTS